MTNYFGFGMQIPRQFSKEMGKGVQWGGEGGEKGEAGLGRAERKNMRAVLEAELKGTQNSRSEAVSVMKRHRGSEVGQTCFFPIPIIQRLTTHRQAT